MGGLTSVQAIRLLDVYVLGPFMIWFALKSSMPEWARYAMAAAGLLTMAYNGSRYQQREGGN